MNCVIAGFGGQGILFAGKVLAYTGLLTGQEISWLPSYGPEMRGGTANCTIRISKERIGSPMLAHPDVLIAMNQPSYDKFIQAADKNALVLFDSSMVTSDTTRTDLTEIPLPAGELEKEHNLAGGASLILLGQLLRQKNIPTLDTVTAALKKCCGGSQTKRYLLDLDAVKLGYSITV